MNLKYLSLSILNEINKIMHLSINIIANLNNFFNKTIF